MTSEGKMADPRTVKHGTVTECPHRNEFMNSYGSTIRSSPEVKTAKCSVDIEISGLSTQSNIVQKVEAQHVWNSLKDAPTSGKQPNTEDNIHGFAYMKLSKPVKTQT